MSKLDALITISKRGKRWYVIVTKADSGTKVVDKSFQSEKKARDAAMTVKKNIARRGGRAKIQ